MVLTTEPPNLNPTVWPINDADDTRQKFKDLLVPGFSRQSYGPTKPVGQYPVVARRCWVVTPCVEGVSDGHFQLGIFPAHGSIDLHGREFWHCLSSGGM